MMLEPFGPRQDTRHFARLGSWFTDIATKGRLKSPIKATQIFPELDDQEIIGMLDKEQKKREQSIDEMKAVMKAWTFAMGA